MSAGFPSIVVIAVGCRHAAIDFDATWMRTFEAMRKLMAATFGDDYYVNAVNVEIARPMSWWPSVELPDC